MSLGRPGWRSTLCQTRVAVNTDSHNVQSYPLVEAYRTLLPLLHIKLEVMKNFVKAMDWEGSGFAFLKKFPRISMEKLKACIFDGSQIRELVVTEVSSYKLPGKPPECGTREGSWRPTEVFPLTHGTNVSQTALSVVTLGLFAKELWEFEWRPRVSVFTKTFAL